MRFNKRAMLAAGSAAALTTGLVAAAAPAIAGSAGTCATGYFCVFTDGNFDGAQYSVANGAGYTNMPATWHDQCSSWVNHTTRTWRVYDDAGRVVLQTLLPGAAIASVPSGANDRCDSVGPK